MYMSLTHHLISRRVSDDAKKAELVEQIHELLVQIADMRGEVDYLTVQLSAFQRDLGTEL